MILMIALVQHRERLVLVLIKERQNLAKFALQR